MLINVNLLVNKNETLTIGLNKLFGELMQP